MVVWSMSNLFCPVHSYLLNTLINLILGQAIYISPNLSKDNKFADIHLHKHGHNEHGHNCNHGLFQIYALFMTHYDPVGT